MKITFLGTGTSSGVPEIGCKCEVCQSNDFRDKRLRASVLIETENKNILIDCGPDFRDQALRSDMKRPDAVLLTHEHYDHVGGLDDLRQFSKKHEMDIFAEPNVCQAIHTRIPYVFKEHPYPGIPRLNLNEIDNALFVAAGIKIIPIRLRHACLPILGFRIGDMAYLTDMKTIPEEEYDKLKGLEVLIINGLKFGEHLSHQSIEDALIQITRIRPQRAYITHMSHRVGLHAVTSRLLPPDVFLAYDELEVTINR